MTDGVSMPGLLDWVILAVTGVSIVIGGVRGLFREALSLVIWVAALIMATLFAEPLSDAMEQVISAEALRFPLAFGALFLGVLLVGALLQKVVGMLVEATGLSGFDRLLGTLFGLGRALVLWVVLVAMLAPLFGDTGWWRKSLIVPHLLAAQERVLELLRQSVVAVTAVTGT